MRKEMESGNGVSSSTLLTTGRTDSSLSPEEHFENRSAIIRKSRCRAVSWQTGDSVSHCVWLPYLHIIPMAKIGFSASPGH